MTCVKTYGYNRYTIIYMNIYHIQRFTKENATCRFLKKIQAKAKHFGSVGSVQLKFFIETILTEQDPILNLQFILSIFALVIE